MKRSILCVVLFASGCLYTGDGTLGLPCNTDTECGGTQLCIEYVCGGNILACTEGFWEPIDCDTACLDAGYLGADSCGVGDGGQPTCFCNAATCTEGARRCVDGDTAQECIGGVWETYGCDEVTCPAGTYSRGCTYLDGETESCACWEE